MTKLELILEKAYDQIDKETRMIGYAMDTLKEYGDGPIETMVSLGWEKLAQVANDVAVRSGRMWVWSAVNRYADDGLEAKTDDDKVLGIIRRVVMEQIQRGPNDRYSGRENDARRARFEGILEASLGVIELLDLPDNGDVNWV